MSENSVRLHRVIRAPVERVYRAFLDPDALAKWTIDSTLSHIHEIGKLDAVQIV